MIDEANVRALLQEIEQEFPGFRLIPKDRAPLQRAIATALRLLTLGGQSAYLDRYVTTLGCTVYVNRGWEARSPADRYVVLCHERIHLRQFRRYGFVGMTLGYLLAPLPLGLAYARARLEWAAYAEGLAAMREAYGPEHLRRPEVRAEIVGQFTGPAYGWMWPFRRRVEGWYDETVRRLQC